VFLAERDGAVRGYGAVHNHFFGREFLEMLMVDRACRGMGIGTALIRHALQACRTDTLWASTKQSNLPMQALLTKTGFMRSGLIHGLDADDPEIVFRAEVRK
jgi:ribosomal protein S18 acetylase RimI-like enzyme